MSRPFWLKASFLALLLPVVCGLASVQAEIKETALEEALAKSSSEGKHLLVAFLGTGWSMSSKRIQQNILEDPKFLEYAEKELVVLALEARRKPAMTKEETKIFHTWVTRFNVMTYPTLILLAPDEQEVFRHGYKELDAETYVDLLRNIIPPRKEN